MRSSMILLALCCTAVLTACGSSDSAVPAAAGPSAAPAAEAASDPHAGHGSSDAASDQHAGHGSSDAASSSTGTGSMLASDGHDHAHMDIAESGVGTALAVGDGYGNLLREAPADAQPSVRLRAKADPAGGWTVDVVTAGFRWAPQDVNTPADAGQGHAHLYVGGKKISRIYGEWVFVPATAAKAGDTLSVVLYADDHSAWGVGGKPVEAEVVLPAVAA